VQAKGLPIVKRPVQFIFALTLGVAGASISAPAYSVEPIVGSRKRSKGTGLKYSAAGSSRYCGKVMTGEYKGLSICWMSGSGGSYEGEVIKPDEGETLTHN
jgi:uncharacterized protein (DUF2147 family)